MAVSNEIEMFKFEKFVERELGNEACIIFLNKKFYLTKLNPFYI
jgi:hypothetical protein